MGEEAAPREGVEHALDERRKVGARIGGDLSFDGRFINQGGATLNMEAGTLRVGFGAERMDNGGQGGQLYVWDALRKDGEVRATGGAQIVYTGLVTGPRNFTGQGEVGLTLSGARQQTV